MRVAVVGATGRIGLLTVAALERHGHEVRRISRQEGVDVRTGAGLGPALTGVDAVIDAVNSTTPDRADSVDFFTTSTRNLLEAEERAGVRHHVMLSIAGVHKGRHRDIAGPDTQDLVDMARRTHTAQGRTVRLVPTWQNGVFDQSMAGDVLLPGPDADLAPTTFDDWLAGLA